ncbi:MAG: DNA-3-methyladenine glycosylase [Actinomycetota bacterium]
MNLRPLPRRFYERDAAEVAPDLLGRLLVRRVDGVRIVGRIVEVEAYGRGDPGSHAYRGPTRRNASMFGPPGRAYVYVSHGIHHCLNVVCDAPSAVLIRALEPLEGLEAMARRRGLEERRLLCSGPGRLAQAMAVTLAENGQPIYRRAGLWIAAGEPAGDVAVTLRVGMTDAVNRPWRFVERGSRFASRGPAFGGVSGPRRS